MKARRFVTLRKSDFEKYGHIDECPGCVRMRRGARAPFRHNDACRRRMEGELKVHEYHRWIRGEIAER